MAGAALLGCAAASAADTVEGGEAGELVQAMLNDNGRTMKKMLTDFDINFLTSDFLFLNSPHHPNQLHSFDQTHMAGLRSSTTPAECQSVTIFPLPCIPARNAASWFVTPTRAKNTTSVSFKTPCGLTT